MACTVPAMTARLAEYRKLIAFLLTCAVVILNRHFGADSEIGLDVTLLGGGIAIWYVANAPHTGGS